MQSGFPPTTKIFALHWLYQCHTLWKTIQSLVFFALPKHWARRLIHLHCRAGVELTLWCSGDCQSNKQDRGTESHVGKISYDRGRGRSWPKEQGRGLENTQYKFLQEECKKAFLHSFCMLLSVASRCVVNLLPTNFYFFCKTKLLSVYHWIHLTHPTTYHHHSASIII